MFLEKSQVTMACAGFTEVAVSIEGTPVSTDSNLLVSFFILELLREGRQLQNVLFKMLISMQAV